MLTVANRQIDRPAQPLHQLIQHVAHGVENLAPCQHGFAESEQLVSKTEATIRCPFKQTDLGERSQERVRRGFGKRQGLGNFRCAPFMLFRREEIQSSPGMQH